MNPEIVISQLHEELALLEPRTPSSQSSSCSDFTPNTIRHLTKTASRVVYETSPTSERAKQHLSQFIKGAMATAHLTEQIKKDLEQTATARNEREAHCKVHKHSLQTGGVLSAKDTCHIATQIDEDEDSKQRRTIK